MDKERAKKKILARCDRSGECWLWTANYSNQYGSLRFENKLWRAHRLSYIVFVGDIPDGYVIGHKCDHKYCVNPAHLEAITPRQNAFDARERVKFHLPVGREMPNAVLSDELVRDIWMHRRRGLSYVRIGNLIGINPRTVEDVIYGKTWKHVPREEVLDFVI